MENIIFWFLTFSFSFTRRQIGSQTLRLSLALLLDLYKCIISKGFIRRGFAGVVARVSSVEVGQNIIIIIIIM